MTIMFSIISLLFSVKSSQTRVKHQFCRHSDIDRFVPQVQLFKKKVRLLIRPRWTASSLDAKPVGDDTNPSDYEEYFLNEAIDSFLAGEFEIRLSEETPGPEPGMTPRATVEIALGALRSLDDPEPFYGAATFMRFCLPLSRAERWGDSSTVGQNPWKEMMRGALSPSMLVRRIRASEFPLLDWKTIDVTEGAFSEESDLVGVPTIAVVNAALHMGEGIGPILMQFTLRWRAGVWLIDTARRINAELFRSQHE